MIFEVAEVEGGLHSLQDSTSFLAAASWMPLCQGRGVIEINDRWEGSCLFIMQQLSV